MSFNLDTYKFSFNTTKRAKTRYKEAAMGDGYRQLVVDGLNPDEVEFDYESIPYDKTTANTIEAGLLNSSKSSSNLISWTGPGETTSTYFTATEVIKKPLSSSLYQINAKLRKEFFVV
jgi:phage-related protein